MTGFWGKFPGLKPTELLTASMGSPLQRGLSGYNTERLTEDNSG
jgi:hypothetical protein